MLFDGLNSMFILAKHIVLIDKRYVYEHYYICLLS